MDAAAEHDWVKENLLIEGLNRPATTRAPIAATDTGHDPGADQCGPVRVGLRRRN